jgi:hypothetical protein
VDIANLMEEYQINPRLFVQDIIGVEPTGHQIKALEAIKTPGAKVSIKSGHGCFGRGTKIRQFDGSTKEVQDICVGDTLIGEDSSIRTVIELKRGEENLYRFIFVDGTSHIYNESHTLCLVATQSHGTQRTGDKVEVTVYEYLNWSNRKKKTHAIYRSHVEFPEQELPIDPYILGAWLGDGQSAGYNFYSDDEEVIDYFTEWAVKHGYAFIKNSAAYSYSVSTISTKPWVSLLRELELYNNKHIPRQYFQSSRQQRLQLLAGIIDTDGTLDKGSKRRFSVTQKNEVLAQQVLDLVRSVGCHGTLRTVTKYCTYKGKKRENLYYEITITRNIENIPTKVLRKKAHSIETPQRNNLHFGIKKIEELGVGPYYGFVVTGDHKFLHEDFTVLHNCGKTTSLAWLVIWYLSCFKDARIPCTAPTAHQLFDLLWPEIYKWRSRMLPLFRDRIQMSSDRIYLTDNPGQYAVARTARKENPEALQGFHEGNLLFLIDEASGVDDKIFETAEGSLSTPGARIIMTANPTRTDGYFYRSQTTERKHWTTLTFSCIDSPLVTPDYVQSLKDRYGENSSVYKVRVLGEFPDGSDNAVIPLSWMEEAMDREVSYPQSKKIAGLDVARFGDDKTALIIRQGGHVKYIDSWMKTDLMDSCGRVVNLYNEGHFDVICVDAIGIGAGVADRLKELSIPTVAVNVAETASYQDKFNRLRDELWWKVREFFEAKDCKLDSELLQCKDLLNELSIMTYKFSSNGKLQVESKDDLKKRGVASPNLADALCLTFYKGGSVANKVTARTFVKPKSLGWT